MKSKQDHNFHTLAIIIARLTFKSQTLLWWRDYTHFHTSLYTLAVK